MGFLEYDFTGKSGSRKAGSERWEGSERRSEGRRERMMEKLGREGCPRKGNRMCVRVEVWDFFVGLGGYWNRGRAQ